MSPRVGPGVGRVARAWGPAVAWAALIFALSSRPTLPMVELRLGWDKVAHFGAYAVLGLTLGHARAHSGWSYLAAAALGLLYALTDELHQSLVPGRSPEVADWVADALGTLAGLWLFHRWRSTRRGDARHSVGTPSRSTDGTASRSAANSSPT